MNAFTVDEATVSNLVEKEGYLPMSHIEVLEKLTPAQIIAGMEAKFKYNKECRAFSKYSNTKCSSSERAEFC